MGDAPVSIRRIDPEAIPGLFLKWGIRPTQGEWFDDWGDGTLCGCINTVLMADKAGKDAAVAVASDLCGATIKTVESVVAVNGLDPAYAYGLVCGWDQCGDEQFDRLVALEKIDDMDSARLGYSDGKAAWEACRKAGLA